MRHGISGYKLGRNTAHRKALFRNLASALIQHGQITTTKPKAKAVQPFVEKLVTLARKGDLASRRRAISMLNDRFVVTVDKDSGDPIYVDHKTGEPQYDERKPGKLTIIQRLFEEVGPRYTDRPGGYTRIIKTDQHRIGDASDLVVLQLVDEEDENAPRVKGNYSRRRQTQDNRTAYAARLRKGAKAEEEPAAQEEPVAEETAEEAVATETAEAPEVAEVTEETEAPEAVAAEAPAEEATEEVAEESADEG
ncbi:MAG: 50S ribosomal protein L17, partial [Planctomycetota bacterium]